MHCSLNGSVERRNVEMLWEQWLLALLADPEEAHKSDQGAKACGDPVKRVGIFQPGEEKA